jgi:ligand-binding sensor domain-containing protein
VNALGQAPDGTIVAGTEHGIYRLKDGMWQRAGDDAPAQAVASPTAPVSKAKPARKLAGKRGPVAKPRAANANAVLKGFDGSVNGFAVAGETLFAATSQGVLRSPSSGVTWSRVMAVPVDDWRFVAAAKTTVVAASLSASEISALEMSTDGGNTWRALPLPAKVTQVSALAVDGQGDIWVGDRDGIYYLSSEKGASWHALAGLVVRNVSDLYYDAAANRILVTAKAPATEAFAVEIPSMHVRSWETGWDLRFVRPVGEYLLGATLFDGVVVQPVMVDSAETVKH